MVFQFSVVNKTSNFRTMLKQMKSKFDYKTKDQYFLNNKLQKYLNFC